MRKLLLAATASLSLGFAAIAQIPKGALFLGGSLSFSSSSTKNQNTSTQESKASGWGISPQIGKAFAPNKIAGIFLAYGQSNNESGSGAQLQKTTNSSFGGGVFYRRYFSVSSRFYLFGEAALNVGTGKDERKQVDILVSKTTRTTVNLGITPGLSFAALPKLHLEAALNSIATIYYQTSTANSYPQTPGGTVNTSKQNQFGLSLNSNAFSNISVGLRWILPMKK